MVGKIFKLYQRVLSKPGKCKIVIDLKIHVNFTTNIIKINWYSRDGKKQSVMDNDMSRRNNAF